MATFKAVVMRHQKRRDDKYPISIRLTHNKKSVYISTGLYASSKQINSRTFEIKDQFIIERTNSTIREYERLMLSYSTIELASMSIDSIKSNLTSLSTGIDYFAFCESLIAKNKTKCRKLSHCLLIIKNEMNIKSMTANDFTSKFVADFKETLDNRDVIVKRKNAPDIVRKMAQKTKRGYLIALCSSFRKMKMHYNTEFYQRITHDPLINVQLYKEPVTKKRAMDVTQLRTFFEKRELNPTRQKIVEILLLSFGLCSMNLIDILSMQRSCYDPKTKRITYNRRKTKGTRADNALSSIRIEPEIEEVFNKYLSKDGERLFDFGYHMTDTSLSHYVSSRGCYICKIIGLPPMSQYWFRHTWATIARNKCGISKDDIDLCLNHTGNNPMADVYIDYDWSIIDRANRKVLDYVFHSNKK